MKVSPILLLVPILAFAGCTHKKSSIQGDWIVEKTLSSSREGIQLSKGGLAASINQTHRQYLSWERHGSQLILRGKEYGEFEIVDFSDTVRIARLNSEQLWTTHESELIKYRRLKQ